MQQPARGAGATATAPSKSVFWDQTIYLVTGILTTLLSQQLSYLGAANKFSLISVSLVYLGMATVWFLPSDPEPAAPTTPPKSKLPPNRLAALLSSVPPRCALVCLPLF